MKPRWLEAAVTRSRRFTRASRRVPRRIIYRASGRNTVRALASVDDRLARAEKHLKRLKRMLRHYYASDPYTITGKFEINEGHRDVLRYLKPPPERLHTIVGELLHNLRSALDHLAWELVKANNGTPDEETKFPILHTGPTPNRQGVRPPLNISGGVSPQAAALISAAQPYTLDGLFYEHPLWVLHRLAIVDRHRHVAIVGFDLGPMSVSFFGVPAPREFSWKARTRSSDEWGAELDLVPDVPVMNMDGSARLRLLVKEPGPMAAPAGDFRGALLDLIQDAYNEVCTIIRDAKALPEVATP